MTKPASGEIACISYLRGLAALGVASLHVREFLWVGLKDLQAHPEAGGRLAHLEAYLSLPMPFFGSGVMLFFVISGFCIHLPYASGKKPLALREYGIRRFFRIYPTYLVALLVATVVEFIGATIGAFPGVDWMNSLLAVFMLQNAFGHQPVCNDALWSLPIEVTYYLLFPLIYLGFRRLGSVGTLGLCVVASLLATELNARTGVLFSYGFLPYWAVWTGGAVLAEHYARGTLRKPGVVAALVALATLALALAATYLRRNAGAGPVSPLHGEIMALESFDYGCFFIVFLWWSLNNAWLYDRVPAWLARQLDSLGTISYSLYLFHLPFFFCCSWAAVAIFGHKPYHFLVACGFALLAILPAWIMYRLVEAPSHEMGRKIAQRFRPARVGATESVSS